MADGYLVIEVYESLPESQEVPKFEFIPCPLDACFGKTRKEITISTIVERGFESISKKDQNRENQKIILAKLAEAGFDKIAVAFHEAGENEDACIELKNLQLSSMMDADARKYMKNGNPDTVVQYEKYQFTGGTETTFLKDAQRLTIVYVDKQAQSEDGFALFGEAETEVQKIIYMTLTFLYSEYES